MVATLMLSSVVASPQVSASSLNEMKEKKQSIDKKKDELNSGIEKKSVEIDENKSEISSIESQISKLDSEIATTNSNIDRVEAEIAETVKEVEKLQASIASLEKKIKERDIVLRERVRAMQANGDPVDYLDVLLGANSFSDFIDRYSTVTTLLDADRAIMKQQAEDQKQLEEEKVIVEQKLSELEDNKSELEGLKASLESQKNQKDKLVRQLNAEQQRLNAEKENLETEFQEAYEVSKELHQEIMAEESRMAELARQAEIERKRQLASQQAASGSNGSNGGGSVSSGGGASAIKPPSVSSGNWTRPAAGRISSEFGYRNISFASSNHRGIDMANSIGTPVVAAGDGVVQRTGTLGTYGNIVMITHSVNGQVFTTLYAHLSSASVSPGQVVSKGQVIASMGNTGRSSGPHLHFEFHVGGWTGYGPSAVNPRSYVPF